MPTYTATLKLKIPRAHALAERAAETVELEAATCDLLEVSKREAQVIFYFDRKPVKDQRKALERLTKEAKAPKNSAFKIKLLPETDWVAKSLEGLKPVRAGRFLVHGRHDRARLAPNDIGVEIEAGQAFGTGHHGTTAGCLLALEKAVRRSDGQAFRAADIGTGTGVLAIALARLAKVPVVATDIDPVATVVATENARLNEVGHLVHAATANGTRHRIYAEHGPFDLIVANILAAPLAGMAHDIRRIAAPGAALVLSGLLPEQRRRLTAAYRNAGFLADEAILLDGWQTLVMRAPGNFKPRRLSR